MDCKLQVKIITDDNAINFENEIAKRLQEGPIESMQFSTTTGRDERIVYSLLYFRKIE